MIKYAYLDMDSIPHLAASVAEKNTYVWCKKDGTEKTEVFTSAEKAANWYDEQTGYGFIDPEEWERRTEVVLKSEAIAKAAVKAEVEKWMQSIRTLTKNPNIIFRGYISGPGRKTKDIDGLEDRYQYNRYKCRKEWIPIDRKVHMDACRAFLLEHYSWVKMGPPGLEADALVIHFGEQRGYEAVIGLKDKDLKQAMKTHYIDMNVTPTKRTLEKTTLLGEVFVRNMARNRKELGGCGLKLMLAQGIVGDTADGYKGLKGIGPVAGVELLEPLKTPDDCLEAIVNLYKEKYNDGHSYTDWNGEEQTRTATELAIQHCQLAYHERGGKDLSNPIERFINKQPQLYDNL